MSPEIELRSLTEDQFPEFFECFMEAFADYIMDASNVKESVMRNRAVKNGWSPECSVGAYSGGRMVGFTLVGLGEHAGVRTAFDVATGIVPDFRSQGLAGKMFEHTLPTLRDLGVKRFMLECIRGNEPAVKAYRKTGFSLIREFDSYEITAENLKPHSFASFTPVKVLDRSVLDQFENHLDWHPSWELSFSSISRIPDDVVVYCLMGSGEPIAVLVYYPAMRWIMTVVVKRDKRSRMNGTRLLQHFLREKIKSEKKITIPNIQAGDKIMKKLVEKFGFEFLVGQYEMAMDI